jgi:DNA-nicking Smr family endonuclease
MNVALKELSGLKKAWKAQQAKLALERQRALEQARQEKLRAARARAEAEVFRASIGPVTALPGKWQETALASAQRQARIKPLPHATQTLQDEQAVLQEAISDAFDIETLLDTDEALSYRKNGVGQDVLYKLRRGQWRVCAEIDLHGLRTEEAREALLDFLRLSKKNVWRCVRVVHGKGLGSPGKTPVLKSKTLSWLAQKNEVLAFVQAPPAQGGAGALLVLLAG